MKNRLRVVLASVATAAACLASTNSVFAVNPPPSTDINTYVLFAYDSLSFKGGTGAFGHIFTGNVGVNNMTPQFQTFSLQFGTSASAIMGDNTQVVANSVTDGNADGGDFYDLYANVIAPGFGSIIRHAGPIPFSAPIIAPALLPVLPFTPGRALTTGAADFTVNTGITTSISPGAFRDVVIKDDAIVTFGAGTYDMRNFQLGKNVTLNLDNNTIFQIDGKFDPNDGDNVGLNLGANPGAWFYVGGEKDDGSGFYDPNSTTVTNFSHNAELHLHYFAPNSWIDLGGNGNTIFGTVWADRITGDQNTNITFGGGVPEPASLSVLGLGAISLLVRRRRA